MIVSVVNDLDARIGRLLQRPQHFIVPKPEQFDEQRQLTARTGERERRSTAITGGGGAGSERGFAVSPDSPCPAWTHSITASSPPHARSAAQQVKPGPAVGDETNSSNSGTDSRRAWLGQFVQGIGVGALRRAKASAQRTR